MRISGTEPSSVILAESPTTKLTKVLNKYASPETPKIKIDTFHLIFL